MKKIFCIALLLIFSGIFKAGAQRITVKGIVFDSTGVYPVQFVSVLSSSGTGTTTDANGDYAIVVNESDSIWFSYLDKPTRKFPVKSIKTPFAFNISLQTFVTLLPSVKARVKNYKLDSAQNREDYAKIFNYEKPGLKVSSLNDGSVGFDLDAIINSFRFKKNRSMQAFQSRLINEEQEAFVKHRFSKAVIRKLTPLTNDSVINEFIMIYLPSYLFATTANDYTFYKYIKDSYERFDRGLMPPPLWRDGATEPGSTTIYRRENR